MKARINEPCNADWNAMKIVHSGRFCHHCSKTVVDFSGMKREEILQYLLSRPEQRVCGRIYRGQLDFSEDDYRTVIRSLPRHSIDSNLAFYLLTVATMSLAACHNPAPAPSVAAKAPQEQQSLADSTAADSLQFIPIPFTFPDLAPWLSYPFPSQMMGGAVSLDYPHWGIGIPGPGSIADSNLVQSTATDSLPAFSADSVYTYPAQMPEFPGGVAALQNWLRENVKYPRRARRKGVEGTVYASFIVGKDGTLSDIRIEKSIADGEKFDRNVAKALKKMPRWSCGRQDSIPVKTRFFLPVEFKR